LYIKQSLSDCTVFRKKYASRNFCKATGDDKAMECIKAGFNNWSSIYLICLASFWCQLYSVLTVLGIVIEIQLYRSNIDQFSQFFFTDTLGNEMKLQ